MDLFTVLLIFGLACSFGGYVAGYFAAYKLKQKCKTCVWSP